MRFRALSVAVLALAVPLTALAQQPAAGGAAAGGAAAGGGAAGGGAAAGGAGGTADAPAGSAAPAKPPGETGGYSYSDKPRARAKGTYKAVPKGPQATFPGFESLPDGGSRLTVQLTQSVPVEEKRAPGTITYVLKGTHVRYWNNTNELITVHFNTPVSKARLVSQGNDTLFIVSLRADAAPTFKMNDVQGKSSQLVIDFPKGDYAALAEAPQPRERVNKQKGKGNNGQPINLKRSSATKGGSTEPPAPEVMPQDDNGGGGSGSSGDGPNP